MTRPEVALHRGSQQVWHFAGQRPDAAGVLAGRGCLLSLAALSGLHQALEPHGRPQQEAQAGAGQCMEGHPGL